jgi:hypothetical protein
MSKRQTAVATKKRKMEDEDLPRGGGSAVTPLEVRKIHKQADSDFLFEIKSSKGKKGAKSPAKKDTRKKRKPAEDDEDDDKPKDGEGLASSVTAFNFPKFIEPLRFKVPSPIPPSTAPRCGSTIIVEVPYTINTTPGAETITNRVVGVSGRKVAHTRT